MENFKTRQIKIIWNIQKDKILEIKVYWWEHSKSLYGKEEGKEVRERKRKNSNKL